MSARGGVAPATLPQRLRAAGRDAGEAVVFVVVLLVLQIALLKVLPVIDPALPRLQLGTPSGDVLTGIIAVAAVGLYVWLVRRFEGRFAVELAASRRSASLAARGVPLGSLLFALVMVALLLTGHGRVTAGVTSAGVIAVLLGALFAAVTEEILFRGMMFRLIELHAGTVPALIVSAAIFGLAHAANPGATWLSSVAISLESGVLLGAAYASTRTLWFPIAIHFGWNFTESGIFGADVSGFGFTGLCRSAFTGTRWMTGGAFGPEAGMPAIVVCLLTSVIILVGSKAARSGRGSEP